MKLSNSGAVPVYTVSGSTTGRALPEWLARQKKRALKNDSEYQNRVEVLQDFNFEEASVCVRVSEDGDWIMSTGTYKPQIHVHDLPQLSLSYARHTDSLNHSFTLLSRDASKSLHLQTDRRLEVYTLAGMHHAVRIPRYGRDVLFDRHSAEALVPAVGVDADAKGEVFRLSLESGRFMKSYQLDLPGNDDRVEHSGMQGGVNVGSVNVAAIAETTHNLLAFGTTVGTEFWDPRSRTRVASLSSPDGEVTALDFHPSGMSIVTGSSTGCMQIFDLRRPVALLQKDQGYGFPIKRLIHMTTISQERKIMSADRRIVKIWDEASGDAWTSVEPDVDINDVAWCRDTGMLLSANEGPQQHAWFVPSLGPAPRWCSFLDNLVEEMADETRAETYENYKFLTLPELRALSMDHLVGKTNLLRPYMHGYFVAARLYDQARLIANPYMWEEERMKRVRSKVEKERASRIRTKGAAKPRVKVNQAVVDRLLEKDTKAKRDAAAGLVGDDRFKSFFEDDEYAVDETSKEFRALNPSTAIDAAAAAAAATNAKSARRDDSSSDDDSDDDDGETTPRPTKTSKSRPKTDVAMRVSSSANAGRSVRDTALGSRVQRTQRARDTKMHVLGERQVTFVPERKKRASKEGQEAEGGGEKQKAWKRTEARRSASQNTFRKM
jgi:ribosome biogenesis protein ENP2